MNALEAEPEAINGPSGSMFSKFLGYVNLFAGADEPSPLGHQGYASWGDVKTSSSDDGSVFNFKQLSHALDDVVAEGYNRLAPQHVRRPNIVQVHRDYSVGGFIS